MPTGTRSRTRCTDALLITGIMERMDGDVEKREVSTGGNGREAESERLIPIRQIIGPKEGVLQPLRCTYYGGGAV
jgi:hypothetical protein